MESSQTVDLLYKCNAKLTSLCVYVTKMFIRIIMEVGMAYTRCFQKWSSQLHFQHSLVPYCSLCSTYIQYIYIFGYINITILTMYLD